MPKFSFKCPATETLRGTAYFSVDADTEAQALALLKDDSAEYFDEFSESDGGVSWETGDDAEFKAI